MMNDDGLPAGIDPGTDGEKPYVGPREGKGGGAPQTIDSLIRADLRLEQLILDISRTGSEPTIVLKNTVEPSRAAQGSGVMTVATYKPSKPGVHEHIDWNSGETDFAVDYCDQNATHILFHEYDHAWYDHQVKTDDELLHLYSPVMRATLTDASGREHTYSWTIYSFDRSGKFAFNEAGFYAYQHLLIHDDLVKRYGFDGTGALFEALQGASNAPPARDLEPESADLDAIRPSFPPATPGQRGRPDPAPSVEYSPDVSRSAAPAPATPAPFPRGGTVSGRITEMSEKHLLMQTSYGVFCYDIEELRDRALDKSAFMQSLTSAHANGAAIAISTESGHTRAGEPRTVAVVANRDAAVERKAAR